MPVTANFDVTSFGFAASSARDMGAKLRSAPITIPTVAVLELLVRLIRHLLVPTRQGIGSAKGLSNGGLDSCRATMKMSPV